MNLFNFLIFLICFIFLFNVLKLIFIWLNIDNLIIEVYVMECNIWYLWICICVCVVYVFVGVLKVYWFCFRFNNCLIILFLWCVRLIIFCYKSGFICFGCDKNICKWFKNYYKK